MARNIMTRGFTLIELVVFVAIFAIVIISFTAILVSVLNVQNSQSAALAVSTESQSFLEQVAQYVSSARLVDMALDSATSSLTLREYYSGIDPTVISLASGTVYVQQGTGSLQALTSPQVVVSQLSFTRHYNVGTSSAAYGTDSISYSFTMSATSTNNKAYSQAFRSSLAVLASVPKIALLQMAKGESDNFNISIATATYLTNNDTSSLLIAVVANTVTTSSVSVADTAGNSWSLIASTSYPSYGTKMTVFNALNAKNSSNSVTATFGSSVNRASIFLYEYRGAATSSSFDASSYQLQSDTAAPSSGSANATSTVELLFGAGFNGETGETPSAGNGFTMEMSSTVSHVFAEDMIQYVAGPVAATWSYTGVTSSSALIVTFK